MITLSVGRWYYFVLALSLFHSSYQLLVKYSITFYILDSFSIAYVLVIRQHGVKVGPGTWDLGHGTSSPRTYLKSVKVRSRTPIKYIY